MKEQLFLTKLDSDHLEDMMVLIKQLNPNRDNRVLRQRMSNMLNDTSYDCFGLLKSSNLIGLMGCWTSIRLYSGKHLELDNVIINNKFQSKGYGKLFFNLVQDWAQNNDYKGIGLNTYVENSGSHKFYFNQGFKILGFHFNKKIKQ